MISEFCIWLNISALTAPVSRITQWRHSSDCYFCFQAHNTQYIYAHHRQIFTFTARALNEEVDQVQESNISVVFVCLDPVVNNRLEKKIGPSHFTTIIYSYIQSKYKSRHVKDGDAVLIPLLKDYPITIEPKFLL